MESLLGRDQHLLGPV